MTVLNTSERIRPGCSAHAWVARVVAELKGDDALAPVTLIVPNYYAGRQTRWALVRTGGYVNVRSMLLGDLATAVVGTSARPPLTPVLEESAVRAAVRRVGGVFGPVAQHRALHQALVQLFRELRRSGASVTGGPSAMAEAALAAFAVFQRLIEEYDDRTTLRERAAARLCAATSRPRELAELGALVVLLHARLDQADAALLAAAARWIPVRAAFARFEDDALANGLPDDAAAGLRAVLPDAQPGNGSEQRPREPSISVIRALDPAEEIREVVRSIARALDSVGLHRTAILYRHADPYGPLVRDSLASAGLPWSALEGRSLAESRPGHALLSLLEIAQRDFAREAVLGWIDAAPTAVGRADLPGAAWDRLSRAANIVRRPTQWLDRLEHYHARQHELANQREAEDNAPAARALRHEAGLVRTMRDELAMLRQRLHAPADGAAWADFVAWCEGLWTDLCGGIGAWRDEAAPYAQEVARTIAELRQADVFEPDTGTTLAQFLLTLREALEGRARPVGSLGQGVLVGPIQSVAGLAFERVFIVGMTEGAFPTRPPNDPFFPSAAEDPLRLRERQRRAERLAFRTALAAADGGHATLCVPDSFQGRRAFPSPWLLEFASPPDAQAPLYTSSFQQLGEDPRWLRVVTSTLNGIERAPALSDLEDRRLHEVLLNRGTLHALAARPELALGRGLAMAQARRSTDFTEFDGNVELAVSAGDVRRVLQAAQRVSASGLENWATCPFQFFLGRVLRVAATDLPEDNWTVDPLERGSLVHRVLERFFKQLRAAGRFDGPDVYTSADHQLLQDLATECFADLEQRGVTGHPLVWESTAATIRADLRTFLMRDDRWRQEQRLRPRHFEQGFGMPRADSWPALELEIGGLHVSFRGSIDRIDVDPVRKRAFLYDYKTGRMSGYGELNDDPVMAGQHVQLALYRRAVLAGLADSIDDVDGRYWFVTGRGDFKMLPVETSPDTDLRLGQVLDGALGGMLAGAFPQVPGAETSRPGKFSWDNCVYCDFDRICPAGRDAVFERKQHTPGYRRHGDLAGGDA